MLQIAKILRSDNTDGGILVSGEFDLQELDYSEPIYIEFDGILSPFFILSCKPRGKGYVLHLNDVTSLKDAEEIVGRTIFADAEEEELEEGYTTWKVYDSAETPLLIGEVIGDEPIPGNYCIWVRTSSAVGSTPAGTEILIPLHEDLIIKEDPKNKELLLDLPAGLY